MREVILDTNTLLNNIDLSQFDKVFLPITVLEELDSIKHKSEGELNYKARKAIRQIEESDNIEYRLDYSYSLPSWLDKSVPDNRILGFAKDVTTIYPGVVLISADLNVLTKARALGIPCEKFEDKSDFKGVYTGYKQVVLSDFEMASFYERKANKWELVENQYLIIKAEDGETKDIYKWTNKGFTELKIPTIKGIKAKNDLQQCAFDLMNSTNVPIKILLGRPGSGKSYINLRSALNYLDKGKFQRIVYVRNPIGKGEQIGYLPGNKQDKLEPFAQAIIDNLEMGEMQFKQLISQERLQFESPYFMKGASKESSWFLVDEAEDLDVDTLKLVGTRLAKESVVCFSGDLYQTEKKYKHNNGLIHFIDKYKGHPLVGIIKLEDDVRSEVSKLFGDL